MYSTWWPLMPSTNKHFFGHTCSISTVGKSQWLKVQFADGFPAESLHEVATDLSQLWYREFYLEMTMGKRIQVSPECLYRFFWHMCSVFLCSFLSKCRCHGYLLSTYWKLRIHLRWSKSREIEEFKRSWAQSCWLWPIWAASAKMTRFGFCIFTWLVNFHGFLA